MKLCVRPTCGTAAEAALRYDYAERTAWLDDLGAAEPVPGEWPLCGAHAGTLRVPQGWSLVDHRVVAAIRAFPPLAV